MSSKTADCNAQVDCTIDCMVNDLLHSKIKFCGETQRKILVYL